MREKDRMFTYLMLPWRLSGKESPFPHRRHRFQLWVWKIPWRRKWKPTPVFLNLGNPWTEGCGGLQAMGSKRVRYDSAINNNILHLEDVLVQIYAQLKVTQRMIKISSHSLPVLNWGFCQVSNVILFSLFSSPLWKHYTFHEFNYKCFINTILISPQNSSHAF